MSFFSKLFGRGKKEKFPEYHSNLTVLIIHEEASPDEKKLKYYHEEAANYWDLDAVGETAPMSIEEAQEKGVSYPTLHEYPVICVYNHWEWEDGIKPLFSSTDRAEVERFIQNYMATYKE
jgi:hypothetical protein